MAEAKGLKKPVKLKSELASMLGVSELPRTEITKKLWEYIKANKLQTKTENGKPENAGKYIVADATLLPIFKNTNSKSKSGKLTDLTKMKEGETIDMMQMAAIVGANIEQTITIAKRLSLPSKWLVKLALQDHLLREGVDLLVTIG